MRNLLLFSLLTFSFTALANPTGMVQEPEVYDEVVDLPSEEEVLAAKEEVDELFHNRMVPMFLIDRNSILDKYSYVDPTNRVPDDLLEEALIYFDANPGFTNRNYITIVDYGAASWKKRLFTIRMSDGKVFGRHAGHGKNSDPDHNGYLDYYSNISGSHKSSKGFYRAAEIYHSSIATIGRAMRLDGLSSTNSNARARGIVFHGSNWVKDDSVIQGRSLGCVTISWDGKDDWLDALKGGSLLYVNSSDL